MSSFDYFLKAELIKIARTKSASYADHLAKILEAKTTKYSSIEDALSDFASRLGINESEIETLKIAALEKQAQLLPKNNPDLQKLKDEGLLNSKAIEFMGRQKNKHTKDSPGPFAFNKQRAKEIVEELRRQHQTPSNTPGVETQNNEMATALTSNLKLKMILEKYAQKVLDLKPSMENIEKLRKELAGGEIETGYKISRYGFEFSDIDGGFPKANSTIKVTAYEFSFNKDRLIKEINSTLKKQLEEDLSFDGWMKFIEEKMNEGLIEGKIGYDLLDKLSLLKKQIFGTEEDLIDPTKKKYTSVALKKVLKLFPTSYQEKILRMLADGEYRHLLPEASGRLKAEVYPSSYRKSSFIMMSNFAPYQALFIDPTRDQLKGLIKKVVELKKANWTSAELEGILKELEIKYSKKPSVKSSQKLPLHERVVIKVENEENLDYKPLTLESTPSSLEDQERLLQNLHNQVFEAVRADYPLAYKPTSEGEHQELRLSDLEKDLDLTQSTLSTKIDQDQKIEIENRNLGLHPSFKGKVERKKDKGLLTSPTKKPTTEKPLIQDQGPKEEVETPKEDSIKVSPSFQDLLQKLKQKKSDLRTFTKVAESGLFMDDQGNRFSDLNSMRSKLLGEMAIEMKPEILSRVSSALQSLIAGSEIIELPVKKPLPKQELPLAAKLKLKILQKTSSKRAKIEIGKVLERLEK